MTALLLLCAAPARAAGDARVAALQNALRTKGLYAGPIDGLRGPATVAAVKRAQRRAGIAVDGVPGPVTRRVLRLRAFGTRPLRLGAAGADVLELQWRLAAHGFPCGTFDGGFGFHTDAAVRRFQRWAGLLSDGVAGPATTRALQAAAPALSGSLARPLQGPVTNPFGPRGNRFHSGIDIPAPMGAGVVAAGPGRVVYAGWRAGGWGLLVTVAHGNGVRTMYAHLSRVDVRVGEPVAAGFQIGLVGATGHATGPHLHFEVRLRGAAVDPLPALR